MPLSTFTWKGHTVYLRADTAGVDQLWIAEVADTDMIFVMGAHPSDDPEHIKHLVRDWIDDGMPGGGPGA